mgnify:FL=1|jgi:hypothetical protein|tara:strand:+ start:699 stop:1127 length:429 start_codon:yes stop_codon:yes gene_type:complete
MFFNKKTPGATLERIAYLPQGTLGKLTIEGEVFWTAERPWRNNQQEVSCIPNGEYTCKAYTSKRFGETFEVTDVENRTYILFHVGNFPEKDSHGCILVGEKLMDNQPAVSSSKVAMGRFRETLKDVESFQITIKDTTPYDWS